LQSLSSLLLLVFALSCSALPSVFGLGLLLEAEVLLESSQGALVVEVVRLQVELSLSCVGLLVLVLKEKGHAKTVD
jgi:hypothetical protein